MSPAILHRHVLRSGQSARTDLVNDYAVAELTVELRLRPRQGFSPSRRADSSRISTLRTLPVTVIGKSSTTMT